MEASCLESCAAQRQRPAPAGAGIAGFSLISLGWPSAVIAVLTETTVHDQASAARMTAAAATAAGSARDAAAAAFVAE